MLPRAPLRSAARQGSPNSPTYAATPAVARPPPPHRLTLTGLRNIDKTTPLTLPQPSAGRGPPAARPRAV
ncbi:hypothetical protein GCM10023170_066930 [Phytohabitans houttuyneae]|uniref:Uncharacterized protein n=1 Tax=Phytohabitans houttuyneae TaxID=1076126 RepID=A0A6V8K5K1_9ACTN|nr:hypothetical protein Phou_017580 [Phytohabitans houttuyneae]